MFPASFRLLPAAAVLTLAACGPVVAPTATTTPPADTKDWVKAAEVSADGAWSIRKTLHQEGISASVEGDYPFYELKVPRKDYSRAVTVLHGITARPLNLYSIRTSEEKADG